MAYSPHHLNDLARMEGPVGDVARDALYNPPLPGEFPVQAEARRRREGMEREQTQRIKAHALKERAIPTYRDPVTGSVDAIRDETGAALTQHDPRNDVAYDSAGFARKIRFEDETGGPVLDDPYAAAPVTTDPKTGHQYKAPKGLPWQWVGQDEELARQAELETLSKGLGQQVSLDRKVAKEEEDLFSERAEQLRSLVPSLYDRDDFTREEALAEIEAFYNPDNRPEARRTGWFSDQLTPEAEAFRHQLGTDREQALRAVDDFFGLRQRGEERRARQRQLNDLNQHLLDLKLPKEERDRVLGLVMGSNNDSVQDEAAPGISGVRGAGVPSSGSNAGAEPSPETDGTDEGGGLIGAAKDMAMSFGWGSNALLKMAGDLYGLATGDFDNWASEAGQYGQEWFQQRKSKQLQKDEEARQKAVDAADGEIGKALAYIQETVTNPRLVASLISEQLPNLVGTGGVGAIAKVGASRFLVRQMGKEAAERIAQRVALGTAIGTGATMQGADVGGEQYDQLLVALNEMSPAEAAAIPEIAEMLERNAPLDDAKLALALTQARKTGVLSGLISLGAQALPGGTTIERALTGAGGRTATGWMARTAGGALGEALSEAVEEGGGQVASNLLARPVDPDRELTEGVGSASAQGALGGFLLGGPAGMVSRSEAAGNETTGVESAPEHAEPAPVFRDVPEGVPMADVEADVPERPRPGVEINRGEDGEFAGARLNLPPDATLEELAQVRAEVEAAEAIPDAVRAAMLQSLTAEMEARQGERSPESEASPMPEVPVGEAATTVVESDSNPLPEAMDGAVPVADVPPPTTDQLRAEAKDLGVTYRGRRGDVLVYSNSETRTTTEVPVGLSTSQRRLTLNQFAGNLSTNPATAYEGQTQTDDVGRTFTPVPAQSGDSRLAGEPLREPTGFGGRADQVDSGAGGPGTEGEGRRTIQQRVEAIVSSRQQEVARLGISLNFDAPATPGRSGVSVSRNGRSININRPTLEGDVATVEELGGDGEAWLESSIEEEFIHARDILTSGADFDALHTEILQALDSKVRRLVYKFYPDSTRSAELGAEYVRMLVQHRSGRPLTEGHYADVSELQAVLDGPQPEMVEQHLRRMAAIPAEGATKRQSGDSPVAQPKARAVTGERQGAGVVISEEAGKALDAAMDGLFARSPNRKLKQEALPPEKIGAFVRAAQALIESDVRTPQAMAAVLEQRFEGKARPYSEALWDAFGMVDKSLRGSHDWEVIYRKMDRPVTVRNAPVTSFDEHPMVQAIISHGGILSKTGAAKAWGKERFQRNKSLWDGAPKLAEPRHNKIYSRTGIAPDRMAASLADAGLMQEGDVEQLWAQVDRISSSSTRMDRQIRKEERKAPKLLAGRKQGGLFDSTGDEPFNLAGEMAVDGERVTRGAEQKAKDAQEAKEIAERDQLDFVKPTKEDKRDDLFNGGNLERDRGDAGSRKRSGEGRVSTQRGAVGPDGGHLVEGGTSGGNLAQRGPLSADVPSGDGRVGRDPRVHERESSLEDGDSRGVHSEGRRRADEAGVEADGRGGEGGGRSLLRATSAGTSASLVAGGQAGVEGWPASLTPEQVGDGLFVERRLYDAKKPGVLLTNGTGTGKTFSGLGVIARELDRGSKHVLVVAPSDKIGFDWTKAAKGKFGIEDVVQLKDTKDIGKGSRVVVTTYANFGQNEALVKRPWTMVVADESHYLSSAQGGGDTLALNALRALTFHPHGVRRRVEMKYSKLALDLAEAIRRADEKPNDPSLKAEVNRLNAEMRKAIQEENEAFSKATEEKRPKTLMLSATPFAYHFSLDYAEGYLFNYPKENEKTRGGYGHASSRSEFYIQNFGYRIRHGKLTKPENAQAAGMLERRFAEQLMKDGAMAGRSLSVPFDYSRDFVLTENKVGAKIDEVMQVIRETPRLRVLEEKMGISDYLTRRYLLEALKARDAVPRIRKHLEMGRKVVVFHDYKKGGAMNPLRPLLSPTEFAIYQDGVTSHSIRLVDAYEELRRAVPGFDETVKELDRLRSPIETFTREFPTAGIYNGDVSNGNRKKITDEFNASGSEMDVVLVQRASGKEGISFHDQDGQHQRVFLDLGIPGRPTDAIQGEGRIYRHGLQSNAVMEYLITGTSFERWTFAQTIAQRASTAENLAMGERARSLLEAFSTGFNDAEAKEPSREQGLGGKERDRAREVGDPFENAVALFYTNRKKTGRDKASEGMDYFATPEPLGFKMAEWAGIRPGERVLEPSAGHGAIARFLPDMTDRHAVEPSNVLAGRLALNATDTQIHNERFEDFHVVNKFDTVVMNPPFGTAGKTAMEHVAKAAMHLKDGGRIVALIPDGPAMSKRFDDWYEKEKNLVLRAELILPASTFSRAGTEARTRIVILDRGDGSSGGVLRRDFTSVEKVEDLFTKIRDLSMPDRLPPKPVKGPPSQRAMEVYGRQWSQLTPTERRSLAQQVQQEGRTGVKAVVPEKASNYSPHDFEHTRTGETVYVAKVERRFSDEEFSEARKLAKEQGGYYSSYRSGGAIPGFHFKTPEDRDAFIGTPVEVVAPDLHSARPQRTGVDPESPATLRAFIDGEPVIRLTGNEFPKGEISLVDQVTNWFQAEYGGVVQSPLFGNVLLTKRGVKDSVAHGIGRAKSAAFAAVPEVIRRGKVADYQPNWKQRGYETIVIVAPIKVGAEDRVAAVILIRDKGENRFYLHEAYLKERLQGAFKTGAINEDGTSGANLGDLDKVFQRIYSVKQEDGEGLHAAKPSLQTESPAFKRWFGASKAVNAKGEPMVMYHGTSQSEGGEAFTWFDTYASNYGLMGMGSYFTADPEVASEYTLKGRGGTPSVYPVYLSIKNPLDMDAKADPDQWKKAFPDIENYHEGDDSNEAWYRAAEELLSDQDLPQWEGAEMMQEGIRSMGFDGITHMGGGRRKAEDRRHRVFVVFEPKQIKSAIGNRGTFDPDDANILHAAKPRFVDRASEEQKRITEATTASLADSRSLAQRIRDGVKQLREYTRKHLWQDIAYGLVDSFADVRAIEQRVSGGEVRSAENSAWKAAKMTQNLPSVLHHLLHKGEIVFKDGWFRSKEKGKGLLERLAPVLDHPQKIRYWEAYASAFRAKRLWNEFNQDGSRKEKNFKSVDEINEVLKLAKVYPEFEPARKAYADFNRSLLDMAEGAGLINKDQRRSWENADYVPFYRVMEAVGDQSASVFGPSKKDGIADQRANIRQLTGGEEKVAILENIYRNMAVMTDAAFKNAAMQKTMDLAKQVGAVERLPMKAVPFEVTLEEMGQQLAKAGKEFQIGEDDLSDIVRFWRARAPKGKDIVSVMVGGKPEYYRVMDPRLLRDIQAMGPDNFNALVEMGAKFKRILTAGVTLDPVFGVANFMRDAVAAWVQAPFKMTLGLSSAKGFAKAFREDDALQHVWAAGGGLATWHSPTEEKIRKEFLKQSKYNTKEKKAFGGTVLNSVAKVGGLFMRLNRASENASRVATYEAAKKAGASDAEAAFQAMDVLDFASRGGNRAVRTLVAVIPFLNARLQGLYRMGRAERENRGAFWARGAMVVGASLALLAANWDDERFWALEDWDRDTYYHFWIGKQHFRIPKPFEVGAIFSTIPERLLQASAKDGNWKLLMGRMANMLSETFAFNPVPQVLKPGVEAWANRSMFTGNPILNQGDLYKLPEQQFTPWTPETFKRIAKAMPDSAPEWMRSPKQLEHLWRGYTAAIGGYLTDVTDRLLGAEPKPGESSVPVAGAVVDRLARRFAPDDELRRTRFVEEFYGLYKEVDLIKKRIKEARDDRRMGDAAELTRENAELLRKEPTLKNAYQRLRELRKEQNALLANQTMDREQKLERLRRLTRLQNEVAEAAAKGRYVAPLKKKDF